MNKHVYSNFEENSRKIVPHTTLHGVVNTVNQFRHRLRMRNRKSAIFEKRKKKIFFWWRCDQIT